MKTSLVSFTLIYFIFIVSVFAATVNLTWDHNTETDLAGYRVYMSETGILPFTKCGETLSSINIFTTTELPYLNKATTYYFAVTAFDTSNLESDYSNIVACPRVPPNSPSPQLLWE